MIIHAWTGELLSLTAKSGDVVWRFNQYHPSVSCFTIDAKGEIFTASLSHEVQHISAAGAIVRSFRLESPLMSCPAIGKNGLVYVGADFRMYALKAAAPPAAQ